MPPCSAENIGKMHVDVVYMRFHHKKQHFHNIIEHEKRFRSIFGNVLKNPKFYTIK